MRTAERRKEIIELLYRQRYECIGTLAKKFAVSTRTIQRDVEILSLDHPIYTKPGRHGGGVYVADEYYINRRYMSEEEIEIILKLMSVSQNRNLLTLNEIDIIKSIIAQYSKLNKQNGDKKV